MNVSEGIASLVQALGRMGAPTRAELERQLGTSLSKVKENRFFEFFASDRIAAPFGDADVRLKRDGSGAGLLILNVAADEAIAESALDLGQYGELKYLDVNPAIPPEGTVTKAYQVGATEARFQFTATSNVLRLLAVEWGLER